MFRSDDHITNTEESDNESEAADNLLPLDFIIGINKDMYKIFILLVQIFEIK